MNYKEITRLLFVLSMLLGNIYLSNATTRWVTNINDSGTGSLRTAIGSASYNDTVQFAASLTATGNATINLLSEITIIQNIKIIGTPNGSNKIFLNGRGINRIFSIDLSSKFYYLEINNLHFINGCGPTGSNNVGGAIYFNIGATLYLKNCTFNNNKAGYGGAIYLANIGSNAITDREINIDNCAFSNNYNNGYSIGKGGAIYIMTVANFDCALNINNSTFNNNSAISTNGGEGGAIYVSQNIGELVEVNINNSTFVNNTANTNGGALSLSSGIQFANALEKFLVVITNSTIVNNSTGSGSGHGIFFTVQTSSFSFKMKIYSSIIAGNGNDNIFSRYASSNTDYNITSVYNIIGDISQGGAGGSTDQMGATLASINLGPLQNNGGFTDTRMPGIGSIAINLGRPTDMSDAQNGSIEGGRRDVGAAEYKACANNTSTSTDIHAACNSYTWINGNTYTSSNNTATHTLTNATGCDSVVTLNLTINTPTAGTDIRTACNSYTWINGTTYTVSNSTATHTLTNAAGCDSVVTLNLTINTPTAGTDVHSACNSYTWIDGNTYNSSNNTATHTLTNAAGCDSVVTLNLTINTPTTGTDVHSACNSYTWIDGNTYNSSNNTATHTLTNAAGCDSVVTLNLTINTPTTGTDVHSACNSYTWIDGNTYNSSNNTATHTLTNAAGCDSVVTLNLTINTPTTGTDVQTACNSYTWINGTTYTASNNTATHTLTNAAGCDSVVTLNLTINTPTTGTDVQTACNSYTWINGTTYTASNNTATHTLTNAAGCDSVVTLNLTINTPTTGTDVQTACDSYTWIDGNTYTTSNNTATQTLTNAAGCDSVVTLNLTISTIDTTVLLNGTTLSSNSTGGSYQWIDCTNGNSAITGATNQSFTPIANGNYAVEVTENNCTAVSSCYNIVISSINTLLENSIIKIYPNPTQGILYIYNPKTEAIKITLIDQLGRILVSEESNTSIKTIDLENIPAGVYSISIANKTTTTTQQIIKIN